MEHFRAGDRLDGTLPWVLGPQEDTGAWRPVLRTQRGGRVPKAEGPPHDLEKREAWHSSSSRLHHDTEVRPPPVACPTWEHSLWALDKSLTNELGMQPIQL